MLGFLAPSEEMRRAPAGAPGARSGRGCPGVCASGRGVRRSRSSSWYRVVCICDRSWRIAASFRSPGSPVSARLTVWLKPRPTLPEGKRSQVANDHRASGKLLTGAGDRRLLGYSFALREVLHAPDSVGVHFGPPRRHHHFVVCANLDVAACGAG